jgi:RHS repeat-associated protein
MIPRTPRFAFAFLIACCAVLNAAPEPMVGTLPTDVSVDNKGSANVSIPLQIPAGRAGLQPNLALTYNSQSGNGPLGIGWSVSTGFPQSITRGRSILARDGEIRGVAFDNTKDKFYLDGKRLICVSGTYGAPGSTYRTEVDSFITITTSGTGSSAADWNIETFVVTDKSGRKMTFGKVTGADDGYQVGYIPTGETQPGIADTLAYAYALKRVEDTVGNYISFLYVNPAGGEYQLSRIDYTGASPQARIDFAYETRADQPRTYLGGRFFEHSRRLAAITALSQIGADYAVAAVYSPEYSNADAFGTTTGRSRMMSIKTSLADSATGTLRLVPATTIHWTNTVPAYTTQGSQLAAPALASETVVWGDFNGDGKLDYAYWGAGSGGIFVCLSNGSSFSAPALWIAQQNLGGFSTSNYGLGHLFKANVDGDGKDDLIIYNGDLYVLRSTGSQFVGLDGGSQPSTISIGSVFLDTLFDYDTNTYRPDLGSGEMAYMEGKGIWSRIVVADFTGDGRDDILIPSFDAHLHLWESNGSSYISRGKVGFAGTEYIGTRQTANNGRITMTEPFGRFYTIYNQGAFVKVMPSDVNGDGRLDYVAIYTQRIFNRQPSPWATYLLQRRMLVMLSKPDGTFSAPQITWMPRESPLWGSGSLERDGVALGVIPGDFNGDGMTDFLCQRYNPEPESIRGVWWELFLSKGADSDGKYAFDFCRYVLPTTVSIQGETVLTYHNVFMKETTFDILWSDQNNVALGLRPTIGFHSIESGTPYNTFAFDVNGDGLSDLVWYVDTTASEAPATNSKGWYAMLSTGKISSGGYYPSTGVVAGNGFTGPVKLPDSMFGGFPGSGNRGGEFGYTSFSLEGDFNGDGHPDLLKRSGYTGRDDAMSVVLACNSDPTKPVQFNDVVDRVTDGLGRTTEIAYKGAMDDSVYTPGAAVTYPIRELRSSTPVVADVYRDSGSTDEADRAHFSYQYSGNRTDLSGRGALGFHSFVTLDQQTNLFKYQFLTQSFPMTGLTAREQTYRFWESGSGESSAVNFRLISSHDNTVVFDEVVNSGGTAYGTVYPFMAKAIESRWENSNSPHFTFSRGTDASSKPELLFPAARPAGAHITISAQSWFDNQPLGSAPQTTLPGPYNPSDRTTDWTLAGTNTVTGIANYGVFDALTFPRQITYGNLRQLSTDFGDGFTEKVVTTYKTPANGLTGLVDTVTTTVTSQSHGTEAAPVKSYTYWPSDSSPTPLVKTETIDATDNALDLTTTYGRDALGRVTSTSITGFNSPGDPRHIDTYTVSTVEAFDPRFDLPTVSKNAYGHTTTTAYHPFFGTPTSVTDVNGAGTTTEYDALGRVTKVTDVLKGTETNTSYTWDSSVTVSPPSGVAGLTLTSAYRAQTTTTAQPTATAYYDRLGRVIRTIKDGFAGQQTVTDTIYNTLGQVVATSLPYKSGTTPLWTKTTYDALGRVVNVTAPNGTVTTNDYKGRITQVTVDATDREPQTNATYVDAKGRTIAVWNADNAPALTPISGPDAAYSADLATASIEFRLDGFGRMRDTKLKDQTQLISATYDAFGRQTSLNDPDKGPWIYVNNALGQVVTQTDAKSNVTQSTFDRLGRPLTRITTEPTGPVETAKWYYYDTATDNARHLVAKGDQGWIGAPQREEAITTGAPGYQAPLTQKAYYYDNKGRPAITLNTVDGKWFYTHTDYDDYSRPIATRHYWRPPAHELPSDQPYVWQNFGYTYAYDSQSYLLSMGDTAGRTWWQADPSSGYDHLDRPVLVRKGSGHWTQRTYKPEDGTLTALKTGPSAGASTVQDLGFAYDGLGNLASRTAPGTPGETFTYDVLNRLTSSSISGATTYLGNGNIDTKTDIAGNSSSAYQYSATKPHAATSAFGYTMSYDANGNLLTRTGNNTTWATRWAGFDKPRWLAKTTGGVTTGSEFTYDANRSRVLHLEFDAMSGDAPSHYTRKKVYGLGPTLEVDYKNTAVSGTPVWEMDKVRIYVPGPEGIAGTMEYSPFAPSDQDERPLVYHYDHLGSIETITHYGSTATTPALDEAGRSSRFSYDAWGERRNAATWSGAPVNTSHGGHEGLTPRGYTGHEMLDGLDLVHMNGRIYDPLLGRMLSADIFVQNAGDLQAYNRYSYVRNNPLSLTDPSGFLTIDEHKKRAEELREQQRALQAEYVKKQGGEAKALVKAIFGSGLTKEGRAHNQQMKMLDNSIASHEGSALRIQFAAGFHNAMISGAEAYNGKDLSHLKVDASTIDDDAPDGAMPHQTILKNGDMASDLVAMHAAQLSGAALGRLGQLGVAAEEGGAVRTLAAPTAELTQALRVPLGMRAGQLEFAFEKFSAAARADDAIIGLRGSAVTGISRSRGPITTPADYDFFIVSDKLFLQAVEAGAKPANGALRVSATMRYFPEINAAEGAITEMLGAKSTVRIFSTEGFKAVQTGAEILSK